MSILFALAAAVGWGSSDFAAGYASRKSSAVSVVILTHFAAVLALLCFAVDLGPIWSMAADIFRSVGPGENDGSIRWSGPGIAGSPTSADLAWGLAAGLGGGAGAMLLFRGLGKGTMAVVAPITATGAASIPVLFGLLTGDPITSLGIIGIALAFIAIVLVSLSGPDDAQDANVDHEGGAGDDAPLTVPDEWSDEYRLAPPDPTAFAHASASTDWVSTPTPPPPPARPAAHVVDNSTASSAGSFAPPTPGMRMVDGELRMPIRTIRQSVVALVGIAVMSAAGIASQPVTALLDGEPMTGPITATLVFSLAIVGLAAFALNKVKVLFDFSNLTGGLSASDSLDGGASGLSWRAIFRQPGVTEALFSGVGFGLFFVFIYRASEEAGHWPLVSARLVSVVMFALIALGSMTALLPEAGSRKPVVLAGFLDAAAAIFFVLSTRSGLLSVGAVLAALYPVATVLLARFITNERIRRQQMAGLGLALLAVALLAA